MKHLSVNLVALNPGRYSLALGYLEANLKHAPQLAGRIDVRSIVVDTECRRPQPFDLTDFLEQITRNRPDVLAFSVFMWNHHVVKESARLAARLFPQMTIVLGGPEFGRTSSVWDEFPATSVIVMGEGETPLVALVECILRGESFEHVSGIALKRDGVWRTANGPSAQDLEQIASPILEGTLVYPEGDWLPSYAISRGCQYHCAYCSWGDGMGIRYFPMDRVERELAILSTKPFERIWLTDCLFGADEDRYLWLLDKLARWPGRPAFGFETRAELLTPKLIAGFRTVRLDFLAIGIQTLDRKVLTNVDRRHNEERVLESLDRLMPTIKEPHRVHLDVILGLPGDSVEGVRRTIDTLHARYPGASFYFELLKVLPGTKMWETADAHGWLSHGPSQTHDLVQNESFTLAEVVTLKRVGMGLDFLQRPHVRPHARKLLGDAPYSDLALAAGSYLAERGLGTHDSLDGHGWLSARLARRTQRALREIAASARQLPHGSESAREGSDELTPTGA